MFLIVKTIENKYPHQANRRIFSKTDYFFERKVFSSFSKDIAITVKR
jgi:hypothetical protein